MGLYPRPQAFGGGDGDLQRVHDDRGRRDSERDPRRSAIEVGVDDVVTYFDFIDLGEDRPARFPLTRRPAQSELGTRVYRGSAQSV